MLLKGSLIPHPVLAPTGLPTSFSVTHAETLDTEAAGNHGIVPPFLDARPPLPKDLSMFNTSVSAPALLFRRESLESPDFLFLVSPTYRKCVCVLRHKDVGGS